MKELNFENIGPNTYLVYEIEEHDSVDSMSLGMLTNNKIPGLAQTIFTQMDSKKYIKYNVSAKVSVAQFFTGPVSKKHLLGVFNGIVNAMLNAEEYMIDVESIMLDVNYIFADVSTYETILLCLPIERLEHTKIDVGAFFRGIMFTTQFSQNENCDYVASIINYLNGHPQFSLTEFKKVLEELEEPWLKVEQQKQSTVIVQTAAPVMSSQSDVKMNITQPSVAKVEVKVGGQASIVKREPEQKSQQPVVLVAATKTAEKEISFWYLMQHYNKQNAAAYKAQKALKKQENGGKKEVVKSSSGKGEKVKGTAKTGRTGNTANFDFAVPGQSIEVSMSQKLMQQGESPATYAHSASEDSKKQSVSLQSQQPTQQPTQPLGPSLNFGETTVLRAGVPGETTVLNVAQNPNQAPTPHLVRVKGNEKILINKPVFRIGKEKSYVDYFMGDNTAISRSHADIISRDSEYFVMDNNSTNHTFLNGNMLQSMVEVKIKHGDVIRLANEEFEFKLY